MKTIIAGSRSITSYKKVLHAIREADHIKITRVISGNAEGVDKLGERYARQHKIPLSKVLPDWDKHGKSAGMIRNKKMLKKADAVIILWDGKSRGTKNMIEIAIEAKLPRYVLVLSTTGSPIKNLRREKREKAKKKSKRNYGYVI